MLSIIGLGLDDGEITQKGLEAVKSSEKVFVEFYTNTETVDISELEEKTGRTIEKLSRKEVEQEDKILETAEKSDTAFLVSGDPITATTHYDIKTRAEEREIDVKVIHAPSILTSVAETGLNVYKFGRVVTLPADSNPDSIGDMIEKNLSVGLHTLVLFDIDLRAEKALEKLGKIKSDLKDGKAVVCERMNADDQEITYGEYEDLVEEDYGETPHCIVIPGDLSHKEEEFVEQHG